MRKHLFAVALVLTILASPLGLATSAKAQALPEPSTVFSHITTRIDSMNREELFEFGTDLRNDSLFWIGIEHTEIIQPGNDGLISEGTIFHQSGNFGGAPFLNEITVTKYNYPLFMEIEGISLIVNGIEYSSKLSFKNDSNGGALFQVTSFSTAPG